MQDETSILDTFRRIEIRRPQYPWILEWIDREFHVIWKNIDAADDAKISILLEDDDEGEGEANGICADC